MKPARDGLDIANALFYLILGVGIVGIWAMLISTGAMDFHRTGIVESLFHLTSEALLAAVCFSTGVSLLKGSGRARRWYFLCAGMFLSSVSAAAAFYSADPVQGSVPMVVLFAVLGTTASALLVISARRYLAGLPGASRRAALLFSGGLLIYAILNVCGTLLGGPGPNSAQIAALILGVIVLGAALASIIALGGPDRNPAGRS